jgi:hypothetical protein
VGTLKFTRKFLTMVCLGMILMHTVGNGKEVIPRARCCGVVRSRVSFPDY